MSMCAVYGAMSSVEEYYAQTPQSSVVHMLGPYVCELKRAAPVFLRAPGRAENFRTGRAGPGRNGPKI